MYIYCMYTYMCIYVPLDERHVMGASCDSVRAQVPLYRGISLIRNTYPPRITTGP